jgi:Xaa-Pro aminopeptidase
MHEEPKVNLASWSRSRFGDGHPLRLPASTYCARRARVLDVMPEDSALLLPSGGERTRNSDVHHRFRPDSDFWYLTGFPEPDAWLLLRKGEKGPHTVLFVPPRDPEKEVWNGLRAGVEGATGEFGADAAHSLVDWEKELGPLLEPVEQLYFAFGRHPEDEPRLWRLLQQLRTGRKAHLGPSSVVDPSLLLAELRIRKEADEIEILRKGALLAKEAHEGAMVSVRPGQREYELEAIVEGTFRRRGAAGWSYPSIVAAGGNACVLHYRDNDALIRASDLVLIDAGCEVDGYAIDVTRTFPAGPGFTPAQRELYEVVLDAQILACEATRPGATIDGIHELTVRRLTQGLVDLGFLSMSVDEAIETKAFRRWYMHRTSHWLGLDVHDVGRYHLRAGGSRPLEPGMVLTVEPGLYVAPSDTEAPERFRGMGIRIEDDVLVTADGHENLTASIAKSVDAIETLRRG